MGRAERRAEQRVKKNNNAQFIHQEQRWLDHNRTLLRKVYAAIALVEHRRHGMECEDIITDISEVQNLYLADGKDFDILKVCVKETGINFVSKGEQQ